MIQKLLPGEEEQFRLDFERQLNLRREALARDHEQDLVRLDEKIKSIQWDGLRKREKSMTMYGCIIVTSS